MINRKVVLLISCKKPEKQFIKLVHITGVEPAQSYDYKPLKFSVKTN